MAKTATTSLPALLNKDLDHTIALDTAILHSVDRLPSGRITGKMTVMARIMIGGVEYMAEREVRVAFHKVKGK